jgi:large subunit ribosomal protein L3
MSDQKPEQKKEEAAKPAEAAPAAEGGASGQAKPEAPPVKAILGRKLGMTRIYDAHGQFMAVTVLEAGPCPVVQVKTKNNDGYDALQLGFGQFKGKNVNKTEGGHFTKAGVKPLQWLREVRIAKSDGFQAGQEIRVTNFAEGDLVDVSGYNKGKGFAGVVKRHRFRGGPTTHGQSDRTRAPGSSGGQRPQKVFKGIRGPGHMGDVWSTVQRVRVVKVDAERNLLLLNGSVPGAEVQEGRPQCRAGRQKGRRQAGGEAGRRAGREEVVY